MSTALLVGAPFAHAAGDAAPGVLKKQAEEIVTAPATPAPVATQPSPEPVQPKQPAPQAQSKATDKLPVNKGTVKKLVTTAPAGEATVGTSAGSAPTSRARRSTSRTSTRRSAASNGQASNRARSGNASRRTSVSRDRRSAEESRAAPAANAAARRSARGRAERATAAPAAAEPAQKDETGLKSITHAAESVVEVIPGTIVLALAGLSGLVLLLVARSWAMERRRSAALVGSYGVTVEALATAIEAKDHTTGGHIERVRNLGLLLAREIVPREARDPQMAYGFLLHDIGKLAVPDAILRAPGKLSEEDWSLMRRHPDEGVRMLSNVPFLDRALDVVRHHHERWDGGGYPAGLSGHEIPLWARIFAVVDALDAMTADRPYRRRCSYEAAVAELRRHAGTQFDPDVVDALERLDPADVEPLLEPVQVLDREPLAELPEPDLPKPLVAA